jgi:hypothetical protein
LQNIGLKKRRFMVINILYCLLVIKLGSSKPFRINYTLMNISMDLLICQINKDIYICCLQTYWQGTSMKYTIFLIC